MSVILGSFTFLTIILNTFLHAPFLMAVTIARFIPIASWQTLCTSAASIIATNWIRVNSAMLTLTQPAPWEIEFSGELDPKQWYLVTANHQSWADILIVQKVLNTRIPLLKFFLKQQLIWVPIIGLCWWALDFPFMKRYSKEYLAKHPEKKGKDLDATRKACEKFKYVPTSVFNFMEGTRFTESKHSKTASPYTHLLKPKAGGVGFVLGAMGEMIPTLVDISIHYPKGIPAFWEFLCGKSGAIKVHIESKPIPEELRSGNYLTDDVYKRQIQEWVNLLWEEKDQRLKKMAQDS